MKKAAFLRLPLLVLLAMAGVAPSAAQTPASPRVYTVEIIVFRNNTGAGGPEDWSVKPVARRPDKPDALVSGRFVQAIAASQYQLKEVATRLQNSSSYQPIAHFAWQQTASSWGSGAGFTISKLAGNVPNLSGIIYLEAKDYLHLGMTLNYTTSSPPAGLAAAPGTTFVLSESRRVKAFERNYFDHPAFGVIALVTPVNKATGGR
ncbi:MAG: hypothetical protein H7Y89_18340 [Steroidobacteraceae bacterium]|nr:hypothetical protein [Steroidobacteraceae bacterium]